MGKIIERDNVMSIYAASVVSNKYSVLGVKVLDSRWICGIR